MRGFSPSPFRQRGWTTARAGSNTGGDARGCCSNARKPDDCGEQMSEQRTPKFASCEVGLGCCGGCVWCWGCLDVGKNMAGPGVQKTPGRRGLGVGSAGEEEAEATTCLFSVPAKECMKRTRRKQLPERHAIKHKPKRHIGRPTIDKSTQTRWLLHHAARLWTLMRRSSAVSSL